MQQEVQLQPPIAQLFAMAALHAVGVVLPALLAAGEATLARAGGAVHARADVSFAAPVGSNHCERAVMGEPIQARVSNARDLPFARQAW